VDKGFEIADLVGTRLRREKHTDNLWFPTNVFHELTELARRSVTVMGRVRNKQERLRLRLRVLRGLQHPVKMCVVARVMGNLHYVQWRERIQQLLIVRLSAPQFEIDAPRVACHQDPLVFRSAMRDIAQLIAGGDALDQAERVERDLCVNSYR
jgi:hypothetical protein